MIKVINGKRYDTEKSEAVGDWDNGYYPNDFKYCEEILYRTAKGAFFLYGEGGALSKYAQPLHGGGTGGQDITPLTEEEARQWLEEKQCLVGLERFFPESVVDA